MSDSPKKVQDRINAEIEKIQSGTANIYFFVMDSKGNPSGQLEYEYKLAKILKDKGYNVSMMYQERPVEKKDEKGAIVIGEDGKPVMEDKFVGVSGWLGGEYASLPHVNSFTTKLGITPSDILIIPEIYASVMQEAGKLNLPCKRVALVTNYDELLLSLPLPEQWGDYGITEAIVPSEVMAKQIKEVFPYVNTTVINPYVDDMFKGDDSIKEPIISVMCKDPKNFVKSVGPFYWKFPFFKWVIFRELRNIPQQVLADSLKKSAITLYIDDESSFGITALQAMKAGNIVVGKLPNMLNDWIYDGEAGKLKDCGYWTDDIKYVPNVLGNVVKMFIKEEIGQDIYDQQNEAVARFTKENTETQIVEFVKNAQEKRLAELQDALSKFQKA